MRTCSLALAALSVLLSAARSAEATEANAYLMVGRSLSNLTIGEIAYAGPRVPGSPFPLDQMISQPLDRLVGEWVYANEAGRVRAFAVTRDPSVPSAGQVILYWEKSFTKATAADKARYTVNRSWLLVFNGSTAVQEQSPEARLFMTVGLTDHSKPLEELPGNFETRPQFRHEAKVTTRTRNPLLVYERTETFGDLVYLFDPDRSDTDPDSWREVKTLEIQRAGSFYYEMGPYTGEIDIRDVPVNGKYTVSYVLEVEVQDDGRETVGLAQLGDPLDLDSGFLIETDSPPLPDDQSPDRCRAESDHGRYLPGSDPATVTDRSTGLMWQRCPVGSELDSGGTPADLTDDRCTQPGNTEMNWQSALQSSVQNTSAGFSDWRVPDIKELESIVQLRCLAPATDTLAFPPNVRQFWSSTPSPLDGATAETISFAFGDTLPTPKSGAANVRLVRTSETAPQPRLPAVSVGRPGEIVEGDDGERALDFPIRLDSPVASDVSVSYETRDGTATAGSDYVATSGTVLIPAGGTAADVQVTVQADQLGEDNESLRLVLTAVSPNAQLGYASALGQIVDDEPVASVLQTDALEPQSGTESILLDFALDRPAVTDVTLTYELIPATATAGVDYLVSQSNQIVIPAGERFAGTNRALLVDPLVEGDEYFVVRLTDVSENARIGATTGEARAYIADADDTPPLSRLNDTGIVRCSNVDFNSCPQPDFPGQDAEHGRDFTLNDAADGHAGFVFTRLDAAGDPLPPPPPNEEVDYAVTPWDCVRDEQTGLYWEVKTDNGGLRDKDWKYSWYNSTSINDGGDPGLANGGTCVDTANCDTEKFVAAVNAAGMCGFSDWRLPTRDELLSITTPNEIFSRPPYEAAYFPNTLASNGDYVTATPRARFEGTAMDKTWVWSISWDRGHGTPRDRPKSTPNAVRLVRGAP